MKFFKTRRLYLPAISILAIVFTLIVMQAISSYRNIDRERRHLEEFLQKRGDSLLHTIDAVIQTGEIKSESLGPLFQKVVEEQDIAYIGLIDERKRVIAHASQIGSNTMETGEYFDSFEGKRSKTRVQRLMGGQKVYELLRFFTTAGQRKVAFSKTPDLKGRYTLILGIWMKEYEKARKEDLRHALVMGGILLVLGSAAIYFIFLVQSYYLVEKTLDEMKSYTQNVVENMPNGLISVDPEGKIVSINRNAADLLGLGERRIRGISFDHVIDRDVFNLNETLESGREVIEREVSCRTSGGEFLPVSISATPLRDADGKNMGAVAILRDMREIRELQEKVRRSERLASLGRLASGIAHEIRNPLSSIKGFAQYFQGKLKPTSQDRGYADIMIREVERLDRVIAGLLDFARPQEPHPEPASIRQILDHSLQLLESDLQEKDIEVERNYNDGDTNLNIDRDQITQAFLNIFKNSLESMEEGGKLKISLNRNRDKSMVEIRVSDTGSGISRENLSRIFDPFFSTKKKGTGLGLAITLKIIENHGGEIGVDNSEGEGTTFRIRLPLG
ncbi:MAG: PAS domain-containing protein [Proteobacteria bacterium]|nr:PAS domain-containing protein [Pseudomonadota bacterium]